MPKFSIIYTAYNQLDFFRERILPALQAQTVQDFEVVIGDDGSSDRLGEWLKRVSGVNYGVKPITHVYQEDNGYGYTSIVNKAADLSTGEYLVFLSGDTYTTQNFLEELGKALAPDRVVNGLRVNVDASGTYTSDDWRWRFLPHFERMMTKQGVEIFPLHSYPAPWVHFTMNTLACSRRIWQRVGGLSPEYDGGYGKMDWSFVMKALYSGFGLWWNTAAKAYHYDDGKPGRPDDEKNTIFFETEIEEWKHKSKM